MTYNEKQQQTLALLKSLNLSDKDEQIVISLMIPMLIELTSRVALMGPDKFPECVNALSACILKIGDMAIREVDEDIRRA